MMKDTQNLNKNNGKNKVCRQERPKHGGNPQTQAKNNKYMNKYKI